jgi:LacI family transcriptional regulator
MRRPTMREVASLADVSLGTVSRVINNKQSVRRDVRERVQKAMEELCYLPDAVAQSMRSLATMSVGCMVPDIGNPLFATTVSMAEQVLHTAGYTMILSSSQYSSEREREILSLFRRRRVDGILCTIGREDDEEVLAMLRSCGVALVMVNRAADSDADCVGTDHFDSAIQATSYLLTLGHSRIGLITVTDKVRTGRERLEGFVQAHGDAGTAFDLGLTALRGFSADYGYRTAHEWLIGSNAPTALLAGANQMVGVLKAVRELNLKVPEDVSLISFGDTDLAELYTPPLTVVRWSTEGVGRTAAAVLLSRMNGSAGEARLNLVSPVELIVRRSCAPPKPRPSLERRPVAFD